MSNELATVERPINLSDLLVLDRTLYDAILDVRSAWDGFQFGAEQPTATDATLDHANRLERLHYDLGNYVHQLRTLATEIRSRT